MHNLPSIILIIILIISWKHELVGAIIFSFVGLAGILTTIILIPTIQEKGMFNPIFIILGIVCTTIGILFIVNWKQKKTK